MSNSSLVVYTKISPNKTSPRNHQIDTITIHCVVGQVTAESLGAIFAVSSKAASSNYGVDKDGRVGMYVEEKDRSWGSSSPTNDHRAVTIEVASDTKSPYAVTEKALAGLLDLVTDICVRNGINKLLWRGDKSLIGQTDKQNMTVHRWFTNKDCPGKYLYDLHGKIADEVNKRLGAADGGIAKMGYATVLNGTNNETAGILQNALNAHLKSGNIKASNFPARLGNGTNVASAIVAEILKDGLKVDNSAGDKTEAAIRAYQSYKNIVVDGKFGPICWNSLFNPFIFKASSLGIYVNTGKKQLPAILTELGSKADGIVNTMFYSMTAFVTYHPYRINGVEGENGYTTPCWGYGWNDDGKLFFATQTDYKQYKNYISSEFLLVENGKATTTVWADLPNTVRGRTAIGLRSDGQIVIYCGGDDIAGSCNLTDLRKHMINAGCVTAIALDGGGSSQIHVKGNIKVDSDRAVRQLLYFKVATNLTSVQVKCPTCNGTGYIPQ